MVTQMMRNVGLLYLRTVVGLFIGSHGLPKFRDDDHQFAQSFESLGFRPGTFFVAQAAAVETSAAFLIGLGLLGPLGPMLLLSDMLVAMFAVAGRDKRFDYKKHELEILYASIAFSLALGGPGKFSIDRAIGVNALNRPWLRRASIGAAIAGAVFMLALREDPSPRE
jgi:putative oxidoreductase